MPAAAPACQTEGSRAVHKGLVHCPGLTRMKWSRPGGPTPSRSFRNCGASAVHSNHWNSDKPPFEVSRLPQTLPPKWEASHRPDRRHVVDGGLLRDLRKNRCPIDSHEPPKWLETTGLCPGFSLIRQKQWPNTCFQGGRLKQFTSRNKADSADLTPIGRFQRLCRFWSGRRFSTEVPCQNAVPDSVFGVRQ